jgi:4-aminobutyrate aminotransferase-like enzyme
MPSATDTKKRNRVAAGCGESAVRFCPALTITERQIDTAVGVFRDAVAQVAK